MMASTNVLKTSWIDSPTASVVSKAFSYFIPGGKRCAAATRNALAAAEQAADARERG